MRYSLTQTSCHGVVIAVIAPAGRTVKWSKLRDCRQTIKWEKQPNRGSRFQSHAARSYSVLMASLLMEHVRVHMEKITVPGTRLRGHCMALQSLSVERQAFFWSCQTVEQTTDRKVNRTASSKFPAKNVRDGVLADAS